MRKMTIIGLVLMGSFSIYAATSTLTSPNQDVKANISIKESASGLKVTIHATGLKPNSFHGIHVHENGLCEGPTFESAGEHFNPHKKAHGGPKHIERHLGDWGNLKSNKKGVAHSELFFKGIPTEEVQLLVGKSVIIHGKADDLATQPSGASGERIACGIINL